MYTTIKRESPPVTEEEMKADTEGLSEAEEETEEQEKNPEEKKKHCDQGLCSVCKHGIRVQKENIYPCPPDFTYSMYSLGSQIHNTQYVDYSQLRSPPTYRTQTDNYYICDLKANEICEDFERKE